MKVAIIMGSTSDLGKVEPAVEILKDYGVEVNVRCLSAHRAHLGLSTFIQETETDGTEVIITAAGMAAALPGVVASQTVLPVIGVPISGATLDGMDALLSIVQMPSGIPVATVAINGSKNAAYLALQIMAIKHDSIKEKLMAYRKDMEVQAMRANDQMIEKFKIKRCKEKMAELLYEGKAKQVYKTDKEDEYIIHYKDDATAGNGVKHDQFEGKGVLNNTISSIIFDMLEEAGIKTHMIEKINDRDIKVKKVEIFPLEVIIRNMTAGSFCKRLGFPEGVVLDEPIFELCYKNDDYGDPLINSDHAIALKLATREELAYIRDTTLKINELLKEFFLKLNLKLVDFKIEFGKTENGEILLADEISPDSCRLWDVDTNQKYDKDVFRQDIGDLIQTYKAVLARMQNK